LKNYPPLQIGFPKKSAREARGKIGFLGQTAKSRSFGNPRVCQILGEENPDPNSDFDFKEKRGNKIP